MQVSCQPLIATVGQTIAEMRETGRAVGRLFVHSRRPVYTPADMHRQNRSGIPCLCSGMQAIMVIRNRIESGSTGSGVHVGLPESAEERRESW
jgi:hypothetical protein